MNNIERGIGLFNSGDYFEAHEVWEKEWLASADTVQKQCIQGMIMVAAALHHYKRKEWRGTERLLKRGRELLKAAAGAKIDAEINIDIGDLIRETERFSHEFAEREGGVAAEAFPRIKTTVSA